jgi:hypothetical protein
LCRSNTDQESVKNLTRSAGIRLWCMFFFAPTGRKSVKLQRIAVSSASFIIQAPRLPLSNVRLSAIVRGVLQVLLRLCGVWQPRQTLLTMRSTFRVFLIKDVSAVTVINKWEIAGLPVGSDLVVIKNTDLCSSYIGCREEEFYRTVRVAYRIKVHRIAKDRTRGLMLNGLSW